MTSRRRRWARWLAPLALGVLSVAGWHHWRRHVGSPEAALQERWFEGRQIRDRHGVLLREQPSALGQRGRPIALSAMGPRLLLATLAAEDERFFAHDGVDRLALLRAIGQNLRHGRTVSGASTVTQQLVKLLETRGEASPRTVATKLWEWARAQNLEETLDKAEILEAYMNRLPYGRGWVGPEAAARAYFGVSSDRLSWAQATFLAVLPRAPSYLDPYRHPDRVRSRQHVLLAQLETLGVIDAHERALAEAEPIVLRPFASPFLAPHFVSGLAGADPAIVATTLDAALQYDVEGLVRTHLTTFAAQLARNAAVIVVDNATGDVLAHVGSAAFDDEAIAGQVDMVTARRQPGSTLKPFVYALAFERGVSPHAALADVPTAFREGPGQAYTPQNYHRGFVGPIPAREALAASLNVPPIRLAAELPPGALLERLRALGFASLDRDAEHYGLALALGSGEVQLQELAAAYVALARDGQAIALRRTASAPPALPRPVLSPTAAAAVTDALADPLARVRLLGEGRSPFQLGFDVALKTGTSSGHRDAWTIGYTRERTVAVWVGNADGRSMLEVTGSSGAGPLFADVMRRAMRDLQPAPLVDAALLRTVHVCPLSGAAPGPACPHAVARRVPADAHDPGTCPLHQFATPPAAASDRWRCAAGHGERIVVLPPAFDGWMEELPPGAPGRDADGLPWIAAGATDHCVAVEADAPTLVVETPAAGAVYRRDGRVPVQARYLGPPALRPGEVAILVDGEVVAEVASPYRTEITLPPGDHRIYVRPSDAGAAMQMPSSTFAVR